MSFSRLYQMYGVTAVGNPVQGRRKAAPRVARLPIKHAMQGLCCLGLPPMVRAMKQSLRHGPFALLLALASCASPSLNPADWYHSLEGGTVAEQRPPPPNVNAAYPNLASVPARPAPIEQAVRGTIGRGLVADRTNAQYAASLTPLAPMPQAPAKPVQPTPRPADEEAAGASLPAADAAPRRVGPLGPPQPALPNTPATPPRRAPVQPVQSAALAPLPEAASPPASAVADRAPGVGRPAEQLESLAAVPALPPPPPILPGVPALVTPTPPPVQPPAPPAPVVAAAPGAPVLVAFASGSAELPPSALVALKQLSQQRGANVVAVTGYGEQIGSDARAQALALPLALERARVVASRLMATGVPASQIRINAEAQGRGAAARLVN